MKTFLSTLIASAGFTCLALAQTPSPAASPAAAASPSPAMAAAAPAATDIYHVQFAKSATGKAAAHGEDLKTQAPDAPHPGHMLVLRHQVGDSWDYCTIEHLGTKVAIDAARPAPSPAQMGLGDWHTDTFVTGPSWAEFSKQMGLDDAAKNAGSVYVVSVYRPVAGQREALSKFLNEPPDATDTSAGNLVMTHLEGAAWTFLTIARYNSWNEYAKSEMNSIAQTNKKAGGWFKLRELASYHTDTVCDRIAP